jgi:Ni/Co efflux regulator RcnB
MNKERIVLISVKALIAAVVLALAGIAIAQDITVSPKGVQQHQYRDRDRDRDRDYDRDHDRDRRRDRDRNCMYVAGVRVCH